MYLLCFAHSWTGKCAQLRKQDLGKQTKSRRSVAPCDLLLHTAALMMGCCDPLRLFEPGLFYGLEAQQGRQLTPQVFVQVLPRPHEAATRLFKEALTKGSNRRRR